MTPFESFSHLGIMENRIFALSKKTGSNVLKIKPIEN